MVLSLEQQAFRRRGIGASEIAAVLGLNKWSRPIDVWQSKTGRSQPSPATPATERGDFLEPALREWYAYRFDREVTLSDTLQHPEHPIALATPDGISTDRAGGGDPMLLEIKSPGQHTQMDWGEDGGDGVPIYYMPQVQWAMGVASLKAAHVVALVFGELRCYPVHYDADLFGELVARAQEFWDRHVVKDVPPLPEGSRQYADYLAQRFRRAADDAEVVKGKTVDIIVGRLRKAEDRARVANYQAEKCRAELKALMQDRWRCEGDWGHLTWTNNRDSEKTDWRAVAMEAGARHDTVAAHTRIVPGPRVFRAVFKKEVDDDVADEKTGADSSGE